MEKLFFKLLIKIKFGIFCVLLILTIANISYTQQIDVFNATTIVELIQERLATIQTFTGSFTYNYNNQSHWGIIRYKSPDKFSMDYMIKKNGENIETGQRILSDGKYLWLVFKSQNIAIKEYLDQDAATPMIGWNIKRLTREYIPTLPSGGYKVQYGSSVSYKLNWVPKSNTAGFRKIYMIVSMDGYIQKISAENQLGKTIELQLNYGSINSPIRNEYFEYRADENTQIYENMLIPNRDDIE